MKLSPTQAAKRLATLQKLKSKTVMLDPLFTPQNGFVLDTNRFTAAQCSRRAGKTNALAIKFFKTLEKYPKSQCAYLALTRDSARDIMWPVLHEINDRNDLGCMFIESRLTMVHPNGAKLILFGSDQSHFIKRLKGRKFPGVGIDEAQDFGPHLQSLINDVLTPSIADYTDGWLALTGTPGPVPQGFFFEVTQQKKYGYSLHSWTMLDNPYMPEPEKFIADLCMRQQWDETNPTLLREYRNKWVLDVRSLWINYNEKTNDYNTLPNIIPAKYHYILGIDIGFKDADAIAVIAYSDLSPVTYLVEEVITQKQGLTELVDQIKELEKRYPISRMLIDEGGLGKKLAEEMRRRHGIPVQPADKARKQENVEFFNDALRMGKFMAKKDSRFAQDSYIVQIDWEKSRADKIIVKKLPHSDIIDAVLYAFKESPAFSYQQPPKQLIPGSKEWSDAQQDEMFESEMAKMQELAELNRRLDGYDD